MGTGTPPANNIPKKQQKYSRLVGNMIATDWPGCNSRSSSPAAISSAPSRSAA